jgi:UDP-GlcNAc3NAcA epimerase
MKVLVIVGARPQFIKHFAFEKAAQNKLELVTIHTGQHYDANMSEIFFSQLGMKEPNYMLNIGSGNHGIQTANMMIEIEHIIEKEKPDGIVVYGDTNSTLAGAIVAAKLHIPIYHIEAGLRSFNKEMPEEVNRILTDHISKLLFIPSVIAKNNLVKEGIIGENVIEVGDIMKDLILFVKDNNSISQRRIEEAYYYVTIHRPYNTDSKDRLSYILYSLNKLKEKVVMAIHPRTSNLMKNYGLLQSDYENIYFLKPQSYFDNLSYLFHCDGLITDSGGMQKEAYWLKKKCITVRKETEWVETLKGAANTLLFDSLENMESILKEDINGWDDEMYGNGDSSHKIVSHILSDF